MNIVTSAGAIFTIDRDSSRNTTARVIEFSFGDGYTQRLSRGINVLEEQFQVTFKNRPKSEIEDLVSFFEAMRGSEPFGFSSPEMPEISANISYSSVTASYQSGTNFATITPYDYVLLTSSANNGTFKVNKTATNNNTTLTIYDRTFSTTTNTPSIVRGAISVTCGAWNKFYVQSSVYSLSAMLTRDYTP